MSGSDNDVRRLEELWAGAFGHAYIERNLNAADGRKPFWEAFLSKYPVESILEVGCNIGANLRWICQIVSDGKTVGMDINHLALRRLRKDLPQVHAIRSQACVLPFRKGSFDLVFSAGMLIHQPHSSLAEVMAEIVRCSRRYVGCIEYFSSECVEVPYRGERRALFKRDYGKLYEQRFPGIRLLERGELTRKQGWDDVTYWMFEKTR